MQAKEKPYAGPVLPPANIVHLSDRLFGAFVACGITITDRVKRTQRVRDVTCLDCHAISEAGRKAAEQGGA